MGSFWGFLPRRSHFFCPIQKKILTPLLLTLSSVSCVKAPSASKLIVEEEDVRVEETLPTCETGAVEANWVPSIRSKAGVQAGAVKRDPSVSVTTEAQELSLQLTGLDQPISAGDPTRVGTFQFQMPADLGPYGALSLLGTVSQIPKTVVGDAFAFLVSLNDGTREWIKLKSACYSEGFFNCTGGTCAVNPNCDVDAGSIYASRREWEQSMRPSFGTVSFASFPHCMSTVGNPACAFGSSILGPGKSLPFGTTYTAKYVLVSDSYSSLSGKAARLRLEVNKKTDFTGPENVAAGNTSGSIDVNVFLVGNTVTQAARSATGQANLNALFSKVMDVYQQSGTQISLGEVKAYELDCTLGDVYSVASLEDLGGLIKGGTELLPDSRDEKSLNLFLVSQITDSDPNFTVLGISGALRGPLKNGLHSSGIVVSTFDQLNTLNAGGANCPGQCASSAFVRLATTMAHEMGHYLGLNHLSERTGTSHDSLADTPICTSTDFIAGSNYITNFSCRSDTNVYTNYDVSPNTTSTCQASCAGYNGVNNFCTTNKACQFNHLLWWTTSNYNSASGQGDGTILSSESGRTLNAHPLVQ